MFRANGREPSNAHAVVERHRRSEIRAAINRYFVSQTSELMTRLFVIRFDAAVLGNHSASADEGDPNAPARVKLTRRDGERKKFVRGLEPRINVDHLLD